MWQYLGSNGGKSLLKFLQKTVTLRESIYLKEEKMRSYAMHLLLLLIYLICQA